MHAAKECRSCLEGLGERMSRVAADDDATQLRAQRAARSLVKREFRRGRTVPPRLATLMFREVVRLAANSDPFRAEKTLEYESATAAAKRLLPLFPDNLQGCLHLAVAGNRVDFFRDLAEVEAEWRGGVAPPVIDDSEEVEHALSPGTRVLVCADNPGELPFDLPLLRFLKGLGLQTTYAVKGEPSQNDLTVADIARFGVDLPALGTGLVHTGTDWVGCELARTGVGFKGAWRAAEVVIAKGMANLETLTQYPSRLAGKKVFFALVAKCEPVAVYLGVDKGDSVIFNAERLAGRK